MAVQANVVRVRPACRDDSRVVARLFALAGRGLPESLWARDTKAGETPIDVGERHLRREDADISWRNAFVAEIDGHVAGLMLGYPTAAPTPEGRLLLPRVPDLVQPLLELEFEAPESYYINALAVFERDRGRGIGTDLVAAAGQCAIGQGLESMTAQVFSDNGPAMRLYQRLGFKTIDRRSIPSDAALAARETILLQRAVCHGQ